MKALASTGFVILQPYPSGKNSSTKHSLSYNPQPPNWMIEKKNCLRIGWLNEYDFW